MPTKYGKPAWIDQYPRSRVPSYPRYRGASQHDLVIVGGGLTGCLTAYAAAAAGFAPIVIEAGQIGRASTGAASGWISDDPGVSFVEIARLHGVRAARSAWQAWRRAALDFAALARRLELRAHLIPQPAVFVGAVPEAAARLNRDQKARRAAGLDAAALTSRAVRAETGTAAFAGMRLKDGATIDPYRACLGIAAAAAARGASIFERSTVKRVAFDRTSARVEVDGGTIATRRVVIATGEPNALARSLRRHVAFRTAYCALTEPVPAKIRNQLGRRTSVLRDMAEPPHSVRWVDDDQLLVVGGDQPTPVLRHRDRFVVQRTGQLMYELSLLYPEISGILPQYGWDLPYVRPADGLPFIGPHRNFPHQLFAFGGAGHGVTSAFLASRILLRHITGDTDRTDEIFGFQRLLPQRH